MVTLGDNLSSSGDISSERLSTVSTVPTGGSKDVHSFSEDSHSIKGSGPISPETGDANDGTSMGEIVEGWEYRNDFNEYNLEQLVQYKLLRIGVEI